METIIDIIQGYLLSLDWYYIIPLILLSSLLVGDSSLKKFGLARPPQWMMNIPKGWRVVVVGLLYGAFLYWLRDYHQSDIEKLLQSFIFALVFHQLIIKVLFNGLMNWLTINPERE